MSIQRELMERPGRVDGPWETEVGPVAPAGFDMMLSQPDSRPGLTP
jgi:hypothetical protein